MMKKYAFVTAVLLLLMISITSLPAAAAGGGLELFAEQISSDPGTGWIKAEGDLFLSLEGQRITGALLTYHWQEERGLITDFRTESDDIIITGREAEVIGNVVYIKDANITKCDLPQPELEIYTKLLIFDLKSKRLTTKGTWIKLYGRKVIPEPSFSVVLGSSRFARLSQEGLPRPIAGVDSTRGVYLGATYQTVADNDLVQARMVYGSKTALEGGLTYLHRTGTSSSVEASWNSTPETDRPLGGLRYDVALGDGSLSVVAGQYQEENKQILQYLPEVRASHPNLETAGEKWSLKLSPSAALGEIRAPNEPGLRSTRLKMATTVRSGYYWDPSLSLTSTGSVQSIVYGQTSEPYMHAAETTMVRKRTGKSTYAVGHEFSLVSGSPIFDELELPDAKNNALAAYQYTTELLGSRVSTGVTTRYDLKNRTFSTNDYSVGFSGKWTGMAVDSTAGIRQDLKQNQISAAKFKGKVDWTKWSVSSDVEYDIIQNHWEKGELTLVRRFHCYELEAKYDLADQTFGGQFIFSW